MRIVLDTVAQGLVTVAKDGSLGDERSKAIDTWFGSPKAGVKIWDVFRDAHPNVRISLEIGIGQVFENTLPLALTLSQLPRRIEDGRVVYELAYEAVDAAAGTAPTSILVIVSDITARVHAERSEAEQREQMSIFAAVAKDRSGLIDFLRETGKLIAFVGEHFASDVRRVEVLRALHTIKGNSSLLGMTSVSWLCHSIETRLAEDGGTGSMRRADSEALESAWVALTRRAEELLGNVSSATIDVTAVDVAELVSAIQRDESREGLMRTLARWSMEPVAKRFTRLAEQGRQLAARIGKPGITVETRAEGVRLPSDRFAVFWTALSHVLRNALDHGIESPSQRIAAGKPEFGHLVLAASDSNGQVVIEVTDDGRGIDWPRLREMAVGLGLASSSERDLTDALFADGVSTRDEVSELSGRGVGLGAVRAACQQLDGHIVVESAIGMGTTMRFVFPAPGAPPPAPTRKVTVSVAPRANV